MAFPLHTFPPSDPGALAFQVGDDRPRGSHGRLHGAGHAAARHLQEIPGDPMEIPGAIKISMEDRCGTTDGNV